MADTFDPYHKWLGIAAKDQPPDHYRLLAIELFESDPDVISNAADQRMAHVRTFQAGERSEASQQILNQISGARLCLLDAGRKAEYDVALREPEDVSRDVPADDTGDPELQIGPARDAPRGDWESAVQEHADLLATLGTEQTDEGDPRPAPVDNELPPRRPIMELHWEDNDEPLATADTPTSLPMPGPTRLDRLFLPHVGRRPKHLLRHAMEAAAVLVLAWLLLGFWTDRASLPTASGTPRGTPRDTRAVEKPEGATASTDGHSNEDTHTPAETPTSGDQNRASFSLPVPPVPAPDIPPPGVTVGNGAGSQGSPGITAPSHRTSPPRPPTAADFFARGRAMLEAGKLHAALGFFHEAIRLDPTSDLLYINRGIAYRQLGREDAAAADFAKAMEIGDGAN